jgi:phospholipase C
MNRLTLWRPLILVTLCLILTLSCSCSGAAAMAAARTPIEHIVVVMQENRSFDHYFGMYPGADGFPLDACMPLDPALPAETASFNHST